MIARGLASRLPVARREDKRRRGATLRRLSALLLAREFLWPVAEAAPSDRPQQARAPAHPLFSRNAANISRGDFRRRHVGTRFERER